MNRSLLGARSVLRRSLLVTLPVALVIGALVVINAVPASLADWHDKVLQQLDLRFRRAPLEGL